jgi:hypothetical protein
MFDINKLADGKSKLAIVLLNLASGAALLIAASWFSYNIFSTRDAAQSTATDIQNNAQDIRGLETKKARR